MTDPWGANTIQLSWITLYPNWYAQEVCLLKRHYPQLRIDENELNAGRLVLYGDLVVRPPGGPKAHPIQLVYREGTPYEHPAVIPLESLPIWDENGGVVESVTPKMLDHRHQMAGGNLCLFHRETRSILGGDILSAIDILKRAEQYFLGYHTGHWPPETIENDIEAHFHHVSEALVADAFFESVPNGFGKFFFIPDLRRLRDVRDEKHCPIIITALTEESGIIIAFDAREDLSRVYPWISSDIWNSYDHIISEDAALDASGPGLISGHWWSLPSEPLPFSNGKGLLKALALATDGNVDRAWEVICDRLGGALTTDEEHFIGLRYPGRRDPVEWLLLCIKGSPARASGGVLLATETAKRRKFERARLWLLRVHRIKASILRERNSGVVSDAIQERCVAFIGLGALGSKVAEMMCQAGVGHFLLCDHDRLRTGNVARHIAGITDFGAPKVNVVMTRLLDINPHLQFEPGDVMFKSATNSLDDLSEFINRADLVICTTADENAEAVVNQIAVIKRKLVVYGRSLRRGSMGRIFVVRPGEDACKACLAHYGREGRRDRQTPSGWIDIPEEEGEVLYHECARPVIASSAIDLSFMASLIARVALDILEGKTLKHNHWVWSQQVCTGIDLRLDREMTTVAGSIPPYEHCPACKEPEVVELILTEQVIEGIVSEARRSPSVETGGVLIGYLDNNGRAVALRATGPGPNAIRTEREFHRDIEFVQSELDKAASELGVNGRYIGEWHSHLMLQSEPSPTDIRSLFEISQAPNYLTRCPVMLIAGIDKTQSQTTDLASWVFPISERMYEINIQVVPSEQIGAGI